jgi:hypothetical protein
VGSKMEMVCARLFTVINCEQPKKCRFKMLSLLCHRFAA